jgi:hypothetical protein
MDINYTVLRTYKIKEVLKIIRIISDLTLVIYYT